MPSMKESVQDDFLRTYQTVVSNGQSALAGGSRRRNVCRFVAEFVDPSQCPGLRRNV